MKIAVITDDGKTISRHFGRAQYYLVLTIEDGKITSKEMRPKMGHNQFANQHDEHHSPEGGHGDGSHSHEKHVSMAETISDCNILICGGMGMGAYDSMQRLNIQPIVTEVNDIDEAIKAYLEARLVDRTDLLH